MKLEIQLAIVFLSSVLMSACVHAPFQTTCSPQASYCDVKTKINHW